MTATPRPRRRRNRAAVILAAAALAAPAAAVAAGSGATAVPPQAHYRGTTYGTLAGEWWNWALQYPAATNPILDTTGASCQLGDVGRVFLLAGSGSATPVTRSCTVPVGTPLYGVAFDTVFSPATGDSETAANPFEQQVGAVLDQVQGVSITVDGAEVPVARIISPRFTLTLPAGNILGFPAGSGTAVAGGFYALLQPLPPGTHVIHAESSYPAASFAQDITYELTVTPGRG